MENRRIRFGKVLVGLLLLVGIPFRPARAAVPKPLVRIGVLVERSREICHRRWQPLAGYLSKNISGYRFVVVPLSWAEIEPAVVGERLDFVLVDPAVFIDLEVRYQAGCLLTLVQKAGDNFSAVCGGVLFYRSDRGPFDTILDLRGYRLAAPSQRSLGGWLALLRELRERGFIPNEALSDLEFTGSQDKVVYAVLNGEVDFGVVRTGLLEQMAAEKLIVLKRLAVVPASCPEAERPFLCTTRTYPEWPLARLAHTSVYLSRQIVRVLLSLNPGDEVAERCRIGGWILPPGYAAVRTLLQELKLPPYDREEHVPACEALGWYCYGLVGTFILLTLAGGVWLFWARQRYKCLQQQQEGTIAELRRAENLARERALLSRELLDMVPLPVFYLDRQGAYRGCNVAFEEFSGFARSRLCGRLAADFPLADGFTPVIAADFLVLQRGGIRQREIEIPGKKGEPRFLELRFGVYRDRRRQPLGLIGVINDLTNHKLIIKRLAQLSAVIEQAAESIVLVDLRGVIQYVNPAFERITGYTLAEVVGQKPSILKSGRQDEVFYSELWAAITQGETWRGTFVNRRKDGTLYDEDAVIFPIRDENGKITAYAAVKRDITREKALQTQLRTAQRLEAVGQLAAGVAHELNTPIGFVSSNFECIIGYVEKFVKLIENCRGIVADIAARDPECGDMIRERFNKLCEELGVESILKDLEALFGESRDGFKRITSIITKLREFSRVDQLDSHENFNLNQAIETTLAVARNEYRDNVEIELDLDPELPEVQANGGEINQVLLNLIVNAAQAIREQEREEKGTIRLCTGFDDEWVYCRICDDGPGIKPENLERIFDPFFTTKPVGKGTGLGLNISYDIVTNRHQGRLTVESEPGRGACFTIALPRRGRAG